MTLDKYPLSLEILSQWPEVRKAQGSVFLDVLPWSGTDAASGSTLGKPSPKGIILSPGHHLHGSLQTFANSPKRNSLWPLLPPLPENLCIMLDCTGVGAQLILCGLL